MNLPGLDLSAVAVSDVAHAMQLALGPVFLLNGVGVMLAMLTTRLARIVDRARGLEARLPNAGESELREIHRVLAVTSRRARLINRWAPWQPCWLRQWWRCCSRRRFSPFRSARPLHCCL
jgi:Protein of unknown function (DUF2721)